MKASCAKMLGPMLPLAIALTLAYPFAHRTAGGSGLPASCGITVTLRRPRGAPPKGPGAAMPGIGDPRAPATDSPSRPAATRGASGATCHSRRENGQGPPSPRVLRWPPAPKRLVPHSCSPAASPRTPLCSPHSWPIGPDSLLVGNNKASSAPEGPLSRGLAPPHRELGTPEPQCWTHPVPPPPPEPLGALRIIQGRRTGRALRAPGDIRRSPEPKRLGPRPAPQRPHLGPPLHSLHIGRIRPAGLLGDNPNPRSTPEGPRPRGLAPQHGDWGPPSPSARLTVQPRRHPGRLVHRWSLRAGEPAGPSEPLATFEGLGPRSRSPAPSTRPAPQLAAQPVHQACRPTGG